MALNQESCYQKFEMKIKYGNSTNYKQTGNRKQ